MTEHVDTTAELAALPHMSVVQFRGPGLGAKNRLVWQIDEEWFSPGSTESVPSSYFPPEAFPAAVLWRATTSAINDQPSEVPHRPHTPSG